MARSKAAPRNHGSRKRKAAEALDGSAPTPFHVTCPSLPLNRRASDGDYFQDSDDPGDENLRIQYTIEPGTRWSDMKTYKKMRYKEHDFSKGDTIFVYRNSARASPETDEDVSNFNEEQLLEWQRRHTWIGRIQEVRAARPDEVYIRVFWFYWPEELPRGGREPYHGKGELVLSNHVEVVDSMTISSAAEIHFWDEGDDNSGPKPPLYWRQTIDFKKSGLNGRAGLSKPRQHCKCQQPHRPDETMYQCPNAECASWSHQHCLEDDLFERLESLLRNGNLDADLEKRARQLLKKQEDHQMSIRERLTVGAGNVLRTVQETVLSHHNQRSSTQEGEAGLPSENGVNGADENEGDGDAADELLTPRQKGKFTVTLTKKARTENIAADVRLSPAGARAGNQGTAEGGGKSWEIQLDCLKCGKPLD